MVERSCAHPICSTKSSVLYPVNPNVHALSVNQLLVTLHRDKAAVPALKGVSFQIARGEAVAVVGESGSGKSTLGLAVQGLLAADSLPFLAGSIQVCGHEIVGANLELLRKVRRQNLGVVFQDPMTSLNPTMPIGRQMAERLPRGEDAAGWLLRVGIDRPAERLLAFPHQLSGGQRQRVMLAMAMAVKPDLILLDEPTTGLDVTIQAQILELLTQIRRESGSAMMFITHDLAVAASIADRVLVLYQGRIVEIGAIADILDKPSHPYTAALVAARFGLGADRNRPLPVIKREGGSDDAIIGCDFSPRCVLATAVCRQTPDLGTTSRHAGRVACHQSEIVNTAIWQSNEAAWTQSVASASVPVLELRSVAKSFATANFSWLAQGARRTVLTDIDLTVRQGEAVALVGESGSGKSSILRIAAGLDRPDHGARTYLETSAPQMVFQDAVASLTPWLSVSEIVGERLRGHVYDSKNRRALVLKALAQVGLEPKLADAYPSQLSGGQCQRAAIARAIIVPPKLLLCDEPISGVDVSLAAAILNLIGRLRRELDMAVLFVTHDLAAARYIADRIVVLQHGRIVEEGPSEEVVSRPRHNYTKELLGSVPTGERGQYESIASGPMVS